jgi:hypothetical protein
VVEGTLPDTAVVAMSDLGAPAMVVVIAGGRHMPGRAMRAIAAVATGRAFRGNMVTPMATARMPRGRACRLNTRIIPVIAAMVILAGDWTLSVTITVGVKAVPGSLRAGSLPAVVVAGSGIALVAGAPAVGAERNADDYDPLPVAHDLHSDGSAPVLRGDALPPLTRATAMTAAGYAAQIAPCHPLAFSV